MGQVEPYKTSNPAEGRVAVTGKDADRFYLQGAHAAQCRTDHPYFHDGEAATPAQAVDVMGRLQLGKKFTEQEIGDVGELRKR